MLHKEAVHLLFRKNMMCRAIRMVVAVLNRLLNGFVVFPSFLPTQTVKEGVIHFQEKKTSASVKEW